MAPKYTLHYFDIPARGEPIRMLFAVAGVEYEDKRYTFNDIPSIKANDNLFPLGQVPVLEVDSESICQSHSITRFLANEFDLYGSTNQEKAIIDQVLDTLKHLQEQVLGAYLWKSTEEEKIKQLEDLHKDYIPRVYKMLETFLKRNNNGEGFLVGDKMTLGDVMIVNSIETLQLPFNLKKYENFIDKYSLLKGYNGRVRNAGNLKEYLKKRGPPTYTRLITPKF
ncbi:glutathione S-transferase 1-like [Hydractinia symbiolongicarpus]|uniref:glutathione S-transferase 1-like n=1 Tax=Hydractinia symbiolongicarpus TaxID=13093 RepID=UPI00254AD246|nr:glutathione S-transferase 1-like [Hydractinia symbiolongicarpus]XP_057293118.1 glutathione S-transferase 1-like [Hydractinia symbiolongicarpus]XP_057293119.1 glutathione S-transferase 1-like [Hydractinia symbiolongicarpus]